ncbi:hypothetical protein C5167_022352, partial [Papaver somniferum]
LKSPFLFPVLPLFLSFHHISSTDFQDQLEEDSLLVQAVHCLIWRSNWLPSRVRREIAAVSRAELTERC